MKKIKLTQGYEAIVDNIDFDYISSFKWCVNKARNNVYARNRYKLLHQEIIKRTKIEVPKGHVIIFKDGNTLNCRRNNLQVVLRGMAKYGNYRNKTRGTYFDKVRKKYRARIMINRKNINLRLFEKRKDAISARKEAERKYL